MRNQRKRAGAWLRQAVSVAVSVALLAYVLAQADFAKLLETLRAVKARELILASALLVLADLFMAAKCWVLRPNMPVLGTLMSYFKLRFFALLPGGNVTGEAARLMALREMTDGYVAASIMIVDKQTQMIPQQALSLAGLALSTVPIHGVFFFLSGFTLAWALLVPGTLLLSPVRRLALRLAAWVRGTRFRFGRVVAQEIESLCRACGELAQRPATVAVHLLLGLGGDLSTLGAQMLIARALGFSVAPLDWLWLNGIVSIAMCLPFSVGGIGLREGAMTSMLGLFGIDPSVGMLLPLTISSLTLLKGIAEGVIQVAAARLGGKNVTNS